MNLLNKAEPTQGRQIMSRTTVRRSCGRRVVFPLERTHCAPDAVPKVQSFGRTYSEVESPLALVVRSQRKTNRSRRAGPTTLQYGQRKTRQDLTIERPPYGAEGLRAGMECCDDRCGQVKSQEPNGPRWLYRMAFIGRHDARACDVMVLT